MAKSVEITKSDMVRFQHPDDARVIVTDHPAIFLALKEFKEYRAAILKRERPYKDHFREAFAFVKEKHYSNELLIESVSSVANDKGESYLPYMKEEIEPVFSEFYTLMSYYNSLTDIGAFSIQALENFKTSNPRGGAFHSHHDALNVTYGSDGTLWKNESGKILQVPEGDLFYIKEGFEHASPDSRRITMIAFYDPS